MMRLNHKAFLSALEETTAVESSCVMPEGMNEEEVEIMLRLLMAEKLSEIEDISTEQIKDCFANINNFAKYAFKRTVFDSEFGDNNRGEFQRLLCEARLIKRRRVI